ncbi:hypothetical protein WH47_10419 [Habropoda laboriosa]|uniref:Histone-lysine N-methyltransferase SETMAR n=1 Tax=Habropoda laboriosa TaxID=597456 RepID=A0A0L7RFW0_9HYME|nr:hypothetical protein WH47_10419 [Habropoda laboriosa]
MKPLTQTYRAQLEKLREAIAAKRLGLLNRNEVILHRDNTKAHMTHPPYSPDKLQHFLAKENLTKLHSAKSNFERYFNEKPKKFYSDGTMALPKRWQGMFSYN